jgi:hypothetical protein
MRVVGPILCLVASATSIDARELSTDRPDKTESPYTVDAGRVQFEIDLVSVEHDHDTDAGADTVTDAWAAPVVNCKLGLGQRTDAQLVLSPYGRVCTHDRVAATRTVQHGFGDITARVKVNLWGNDGGRTALALMPFVDFPTSQDSLGASAMQGGLIVPLAVELPANWGMGVMTEVDWTRNAADTRTYAEFVNSITFSHDLAGDLAGYVELWSKTSREPGTDWEGTFDLGLTYGLTEDIQLDAGCNFGVTSAPSDVNAFLGVSARF